MFTYTWYQRELWPIQGALRTVSIYIGGLSPVCSEGIFSLYSLSLGVGSYI